MRPFDVEVLPDFEQGDPGFTAASATIMELKVNKVTTNKTSEDFFMT
jgi:hypothetical protein